MGTTSFVFEWINVCEDYKKRVAPSKSLKMDPEAFLDLANQVTKLKMYPYFDLAHAAFCCLAVRDDLASGSLSFSRKHPLALWVSSMLVIFAGGILANLHLGEPVLAPLKNNNPLLLSTVVWYLIFYSPFDVGYKFFKFLPIKVICAALKEVYRAKKVHDGVTQAAKLFPCIYCYDCHWSYKRKWSRICENRREALSGCLDSCG